MRRNADDTVIVPPPRPPRRTGRLVAAAAVLAVLLGGTFAGFTWFHRAPPAVATLPPIPSVTEADLQVESPAARTLLRFAPNPAVLVLDFPTLAEQGAMLNRVAALVEKAGVPHDRLLNDAELADAIRSSGATPDTYYYGHDYPAADITRFFQLADRDHVPLHPQEEDLRHIAAQVAAEPLGFGALITLPRADAANGVDAVSRAVILHHELSHGEFFTNAVYARYVRTIWESVLSEDERAKFRTYLADEGYDPALETLMVNEMQAYLMHTPDKRFFDEKKLGIAPVRLAQVRQSFASGMPSCWLRDETSATPTLPSIAPQRRAPRLRIQALRLRQGPGRVSRTTAAAEMLPPRRRRASIAVCRAAR